VDPSLLADLTGFANWLPTTKKVRGAEYGRWGPWASPGIFPDAGRVGETIGQGEEDSPALSGLWRRTAGRPGLAGPRRKLQAAVNNEGSHSPLQSMQLLIGKRKPWQLSCVYLVGEGGAAASAYLAPSHAGSRFLSRGLVAGSDSVEK